MRLWSLQLAIIAAWLLVGVGVVALGQIRAPSENLRRMCAAVSQDPDDQERAMCAEFSVR